MRFRTTRFQSAMIIIASLAASACGQGPKGAHGFRLPDGDAEAGQQAFAGFGCPSCHEIAGLEALREGVDPEMNITLGGETTRIATYGELVTSVINPSHRIAKAYEAEAVAPDGVSKMRNYNDVLTVTELIDLVAFLQAQYEIKPYPDPDYSPYSYR